MKITFVLPYAGLQGGIRVIAYHAERLARRGHEVRLISTPQPSSIRRSVKSLLLGKGIPRAEPSYVDQLDLPHRVLDSIRPVTDADVEDGDVVVATFYTTARGVLQLAPSKGAKAIFIQSYEVEEGRPNPMLDESWRMPMHKITISNWLVQLARDKFGDTCVSHVPNSVDLQQFFAPPRTRGQHPTVGLLYATWSLKGCRTSLAALKEVAAVLPSLRLVSFGAEPLDFRLPLPGFAEFHYRPAQDQLRELYARCDVWLCGSLVEGFHLPPLEAMACRCPVVSTRVGGPLDIVENGVNGYLVDLKDERALAARMLQVLTLAPGDWQRMSEAAYRTATRYTWDDATDLFEAALLQAVERTRRGDFRQGGALPERPRTAKQGYGY